MILKIEINVAKRVSGQDEMREAWLALNLFVSKFGYHGGILPGETWPLCDLAGNQIGKAEVVQ